MTTSFLSDAALQAINATVQQGGIIAYPTEAVFGLGCAPDNEASLQRLIDLKGRPENKGLILVAAKKNQLDPWVDFHQAAYLQEIENSWPGPHTWLVPARVGISDLLTGGSTLLAVRVSAHPLVQALCQTLGPITSTSANPANQSPALTAEQVQDYFPSGVDYIVDGGLGQNSKPTTIRHAISGEVIRAGG